MSDLRTYTDLVQGTQEWLDVRRGIVTASVVGQLIATRPPSALTGTCPECNANADEPCVSLRGGAPIKTLHGTRTAADDAPIVIATADNDTSRGLTLTLAAERITGWVEEVYVSNDMLRGTLDEPIARAKYAEHHAPVTEVGFMVRDFDDYKIGYSPDGLVGDDGLIEIKSRRPKRHLADVLADVVPIEHMAQIQAGLLVSGREWCDYVSFSGGMALYVKRAHVDERWVEAIRAAVEIFERNVEQMVAAYRGATAGLPMTDRSTYDMEMVV